MKCQCLFSWTPKKNIISLSSAEFSQKVIKVNSNSFATQTDAFIALTCCQNEGESIGNQPNLIRLRSISSFSM